MIEIRNLTKSYRVKGGRHYVFKDVQATFPEGANIGIIGPNGGGKSTFLRILGGIDFPDSGSVVSDRSFSWPLGLKGGFVGHLSGRENCRMVCNLYGLSSSETRRKLGAIKELSGIGAYFEEPVDYYSSGMSGRLGFALSMSFDFDYFLIDEVTSVGDAHFKALARQAFTEKLGKSKMIMVSHNMGDIKKFCDVAVLVKDGGLRVFEDIDLAIRHYLPQTKEAAADAAESRIQVALEDLKLTTSDLSEDEEQALAETNTLLKAVERKLDVSQHRIAGDPADFHFRLGGVYQTLGDEVRALDRYREAVAANACHLRAQQRLAQIAGTRGLVADEDKALAAAESLDPLNADTLALKLSYLIRMRRLDEALVVCDQALRVKPDNAGFWSRRAWILLAKGDVAGALEAQMKVSKSGAEDGAHLQQLAVILSAMGDQVAAMRCRRRAARIAAQPRPARTISYPSLKTTLRRLDDRVHL